MLRFGGLSTATRISTPLSGYQGARWPHPRLHGLGFDQGSPCRLWELWDLPQMVTQHGASTPDSPPDCSRAVPTCTKSLRPDDLGALVPLSPLSCLSLSVETPWGSQCSGLLLGRLAWPPEQTVPAHTVPHWRCSSFPWFPLRHSDCRLLQTQPSPPCCSLRISHYHP